MAQRITIGMIREKIAELNEKLNGDPNYYGPGAVVEEGAYGCAGASLVGFGYIAGLSPKRQAYEELCKWQYGKQFNDLLATKKGEPK